MKKVFILLLCIFLLCGCNNSNSKNKTEKKQNKENETSKKEDLKDPVLEWCQLYNPNGFDTITCVMSNPNDVDIDVSYDLVFYKDGKEVERQDANMNFQVSNNHNEVIWGNFGIPKSSEVDEIKMENIVVNKSEYDSIKVDIELTDKKDGLLYYSVKHEKKPILNNIYVFIYEDKNENGKCDKNELYITEYHSCLELEDKFTIDDYGDNYKYEVYYNAY